MSFPYRALWTITDSWAISLPVAALLRVRSGWPFQAALAEVMFALISAFSLVTSKWLYAATGVRFRAAWLLFCLAVTLLWLSLAAALIFSMEFPYMPAIAATLLLCAAWIGIAFGLRGYSPPAPPPESQDR